MSTCKVERTSAEGLLAYPSQYQIRKRGWSQLAGNFGAGAEGNLPCVPFSSLSSINTPRIVSIPTYVLPPVDPGWLHGLKLTSVETTYEIGKWGTK